MSASRSGLRRALVRGLLFSLPLLVTWFLLSFLFQQVNATVTPPLTGLFRLVARVAPSLSPDRPLMKVAIPLLGLLLVLTLMATVGAMASHYLGKRILHAAEQGILRVPFVRAVYGATRQVVDSLRGETMRAVERIVLLEYPRPGLLAVGFVTRKPGPKVTARLGSEPYVFVFVPTTPNPTSGVFVLAREADLIDADLTVEEAVKAVVSGGMISEALPPAPPATGAS